MTLIEQLKRDEGCRRVGDKLADYLDSKGLWTRGYGHLIIPQPGPGYVAQQITEAEALALLEADIKSHSAELLGALPWVTTLDEVVREALINMTFNLGVYRLRGFRGFLSELQRGNIALAVIEGLDSKWHREDVGPRAVRLMKQIATKVRQ